MCDGGWAVAPSHPMWSSTFWGLREKVGAGSRPESVSEVSLALLNISESFQDSFLPVSCFFFFFLIILGTKSIGTPKSLP